MVFILGNNYLEVTLLKKALESFYGVGSQASSRIMARHFIQPRATVGSIPAKTILAINADLSEMTIENDLRRKLRDNLARLRDMGSYRGRRHAMNLPVRGQRTRTQITTARRLNKVDRAN